MNPMVLARRVYNLMPDGDLKRRAAAMFYRRIYRAHLEDCRWAKGCFTVTMRDGARLRSVVDFDPVPLCDNFHDLTIPPNGIAVDLGGNIGATALYLAHRVGSGGRVYVYEPDEENFALLQQNLALNAATNITPVRTGIWDHEGTLSFFADGRYTSSFLKTTYVEQEPEAYRVTEVPVTTLDREAERLGWTRLDLVKIDIEGSEPQAIRGAEGSLRQFRPDLIVETHCVEGRSNAEEVAALLRALAYEPEIRPDREGQPVIIARGR